MLALSTYLPAWESFREKVTAANKSTPILVCHGENDQVLPNILGKDLSDKLSENGFINAYKSYPDMEHSVCPDEIIDISN